MKRTRSGTVLLVTATALVAGSLVPTAHAATPDAARKPAAYTIKVKASPQDVVLGEGVVTVRGRVKPRASASGKKLVLERRATGESAWSVAGKTKIKSDGTYRFTDEPTVARTLRYRVVKRRSGGVKKGISPVVEVRVYGWEKLAQRPRGAFENIAVSSTAVIGGVPYPYSFQPFTRGATSFVEYPLKGLCTDLRATYAMHDSAAEGSSSRITLAVDGVAKVDQPLVKGQVVASTTDLTGASMLRYDLVSSAAPASYPVVVAPEVLCTK